MLLRDADQNMSCFATPAALRTFTCLDLVVLNMADVPFFRLFFRGAIGTDMPDFLLVPLGRRGAGILTALFFMSLSSALLGCDTLTIFEFRTLRL